MSGWCCDELSGYATEAKAMLLQHGELCAEAREAIAGRDITRLEAVKEDRLRSPFISREEAPSVCWDITTTEVFEHFIAVLEPPKL